MPKRKTDEQFKQEVFGLVGNEYTFLDRYTNNQTKLRVKHIKCGNIYRVLPSNFLKGTRCPYCRLKARGKARRKTNAQFKQEVKNLVENEYIFLDTYQGTDTKIRVKHNKCGYVYSVAPTIFLSGKRCPNCFGNTKKTDVQFKKEVYDLVGNEYTFIDTYINALTKIKVRHNKCNQVYEVTPAHFLTGRRCPYCFGKHKKTNTQFKPEVFGLVGNEYTFLDSLIIPRLDTRYFSDGGKAPLKHLLWCFFFRFFPFLNFTYKYSIIKL